MRSLLVALVCACAFASADARAQDPPSAEPPAPEPSAGDNGGEGTPQAVGPGTASGPPPLGNEPGVDAPVEGLANTAAAPRPTTATFPTGGTDASSDEPYLYLGLGLGLLVLVGVALVWRRGGGAAPEPDTLPDGVQRLPSPPLLGAPLPSLSDGLQVWSVDAEHEAALTTDLLATLADACRLLVVAPSDRAVPHVAGGPVYRVTGQRPVHLEDPIDILATDGGRPPAVVLLLPPDRLEALPEYADALPAGTGGVALTTTATATAFPVVDFSPTPHGWIAQRGADTLQLRRLADGRLVAGAEESEE
jgi:hypothetical protein